MQLNLISRQGSAAPFNLQFSGMAELKNGDYDSLFHITPQLEYVLVFRACHEVSSAVELAEFQCYVESESAFFGDKTTVGQNARRLW